MHKLLGHKLGMKDLRDKLGMQKCNKLGMKNGLQTRYEKAEATNSTCKLNETILDMQNKVNKLDMQN